MKNFSIFYIVIVLCFFFSKYLYPQEKLSSKKDNKNKVTEKNQNSKDHSTQEKEKIEAFEKMKKTLKYGITKERVSVLKKIKKRDKKEIRYFYEDLDFIFQKEKNWRLKIHALQVVEALKLEKFKEAVILCLDDKFEPVQKQAILTVQKLKINESVSKMIGLLKNQDLTENSNLTASLIQTLAELKNGEKAYNFLLSEFQNTNNNRTIRNEILLYFGKIKINKEAIKPILIETFQNKKEHSTTQAYAVYVLGKLKIKDSIPLLNNLLKSINESTDKEFLRKSHFIKIRIITALADMGDKNINRLLVEMAKDDNDSVRARAIEALGELEYLDKESQNLLEYKVKNDPNHKIRKLAKKTINEIKEKSTNRKNKPKMTNKTTNLSQKKEEDFIDNKNN